jgi:endonuclease YncB( thermonuclease family)
MLHSACRIYKRASWFGALFVWALVFPYCVRAEPNSECAADHIDEWGQVGYIFDGDTIRLTDQRIIRFIAINAPELAHDGRQAEPLAEAAKARLSRLLPVGSRVGLRFDKEHLGPHRRVLAHIFDSQGRNISVALLREGYAFAIAIPPNLWQSSCYFKQEAGARTGKLGIWAQPYYQPKQAQQLHTRVGGFYRVTGRVEHIGISQRSVWLDMSNYFAVRIPRKQLPYFSSRPLEALQDKVITVRGWARFYNNKLNMTLTHPAMLENTP